MNINKTNKQAIHDALITDMQRRLYNDYKVMRKNNPQVTAEDYDNALSTMVNSILHTNNMRDINDLLLEYLDLFEGYDNLTIATVDGTLNYVLGLFVSKLNYLKENNGE